MFRVLSKYPNPCSRMLEMDPKRPKVSNFPGEHTPGPSQNLAPSPQVVHSPPTPEILPPTQIPIENPGLLVQMLYH